MRHCLVRFNTRSIIRLNEQLFRFLYFLSFPSRTYFHFPSYLLTYFSLFVVERIFFLKSLYAFHDQYNNEQLRMEIHILRCSKRQNFLYTFRKVCNFSKLQFKRKILELKRYVIISYIRNTYIQRRDKTNNSNFEKIESNTFRIKKRIFNKKIVFFLFPRYKSQGLELILEKNSTTLRLVKARVVLFW